MSERGLPSPLATNPPDYDADEPTECLACGEEIEGEVFRSETLDGPICLGCKQEGDNP